MMTSSNGNIFRVTDPLCGEFTPVNSPHKGQWRGALIDVFFDLGLNKRLSKQSWGWWFEMPTRPLWRHCNDVVEITPSEVGMDSYSSRNWGGLLQTFWLYWQDNLTLISQLQPHLFKMQWLSFTNKHRELSSWKCRSLCLGFILLNQ